MSLSPGMTSPETIKVIYENLGQIPGTGTDYYHETLLYTNSQGQQFIASGAASGQNPPTTLLGQLSALSAAATGAPTAYGTLQSFVVPVDSLAAAVIWPNITTPGAPGSILAENNPQVTVATDFDLSGAWAKIAQAEQEVGAASENYSPLTLNSNSLASTALTAAGIDLPTTILGSALWAPGANNILPTSLTEGYVGSTTQVIDSGGIPIYSITDKDSSGATTSNIQINPINQSVNLAGYNSGGVQFTANTTTAAGGAMTASLSGNAVAQTLDDATVTLAPNTQAIVNGSLDQILAQANAMLAVSGTDQSVIAGTNSIVTSTVIGANLSLGAGSALTVSGGTANATLSNGTVTVQDGGAATVTGDHNTETADCWLSAIGNFLGITTGDGDTLSAAGNSETVTAGTDDTVTLTGNSDGVTLGTGDNLSLSGSGETVNGSSDTITATSGTSLNNLIGSNDTVHLNGSADYLGVIGGSGDTVYATGDTIATTAGTTLSNLVGSGDLVELASGNYLGVIGGSGDTINASGDTIVATAGTSAANLNGNNDSVALGTDVGLTVFGVGNTVSGYSNDDIAFGYSASMTGTDIVNWADSNSVGADSWRAVFNPTSTEAVTISDWSGVNATGTLYDQVIDWTAGGSQLDWYNPEKDVSSVIGNFSGANETGDLTTETLNTTSGKSEDFDFDYNSNNQFIGYTEDYYSGSTLLGSADFNSYGQDVGQTGSVGSYGYYLGGYDLASSPTITASAPKGTHISEIASHDLNSGQFGAASAAETAFFQAQLTANSSSQSGVLAPSVHEAKWASGPITWSLATLAGSAASPFSSHMGEQYQAAVQAAFAQWGAATGLDFVEVAHIALGSTSTLTEGGPVELGPGMSVTAEIKTGKRRVISYFLSPIARHRRENLREKRNNISSILRISSSIESFLMRNHFKPLHIDKIFTINVIIIVINGVFLAGCTTRDKITVLNDKTGERATCYSGYYTIEEGLQQLEVMTQCLRACAQFGFQPTPLEKYSKYSPKEPDEKFLSQIPSQCKR